jgi:hypothetical protein
MPNADAVAQRLPVAEHEIEIGFRRIDEDRAGRLLGIVITSVRRNCGGSSFLGPVSGRTTGVSAATSREWPWWKAHMRTPALPQPLTTV